ncbi:uncharacterized protein N7506_002800 [Penicillium brevicompactum]|uniref:uncharacterized protein n=1 Tax=Penicillium brevicompactum TaxID=5074 RepID=UPI002541562B|nr:uncharacterized protein N7506_002800 [Penicillium brevicompactum]KAJ5342976.1 hypothetical protein N7506_002800 [Penicillium brevicompactum]
MFLFSGRRVMTSPLAKLCRSASVLNVESKRSVATVLPHRPHPNPGNFANRSHDELSAMGHKGGKKGGKARGGESQGHQTDKHVRIIPDIHQHRLIWSEGMAKASRRKAAEHEESELEAKQRGRSSEPSIVPPGFEEWKTCA